MIELLQGITVSNCPKCRGSRSRCRRCKVCEGRGVLFAKNSHPIRLKREPTVDLRPHPHELRKRDRDKAEYDQRRADGVCVKCASPDLLTKTLCESCNTHAKSIRQTLGRGEIG